jgi:asparagine synthase (glutamine-hydrolysing)
MIFALTGETAYEAPFSRPDSPLLISPLASQPLVECCLRIATHLSATDGWSRAVARLAFADDLPLSISTRATKGSHSPWMEDVLRNNLEFAREFLLDGVLAKEHFLDRTRLETALGHPPVKSTWPVTQIVRQMYNEAWVRRWRDAERRLRAAA